MRVTSLIGSTRRESCNFRAMARLHARARCGATVAFTRLPIPSRTDVPAAEPDGKARPNNAVRASENVVQAVANAIHEVAIAVRRPNNVIRAVERPLRALTTASWHVANAPEDITTLSPTDVLAVLGDVPSTELPAADFSGEGVGIVDLVARIRLAPSKSEARRLVQSGGVYVNNRRRADPQDRIAGLDAIGNELVVVRKGARELHVVRLT